eukprot:7051219-Pyramimonas_sp.AAC.1
MRGGHREAREAVVDPARSFAVTAITTPEEGEAVAGPKPQGQRGQRDGPRPSISFRNENHERHLSLDRRRFVLERREDVNQAKLERHWQQKELARVQVVAAQPHRRAVAL